MPVDINKHKSLKPLINSLVALDRADKAMDSFQLWRRLLEVHSLQGHWEGGLQQRLEEAQTEAVTQILPLVIDWKKSTPVRYSLVLRHLATVHVPQSEAVSYSQTQSLACRCGSLGFSGDD